MYYICLHSMEKIAKINTCIILLIQYLLIFIIRKTIDVLAKQLPYNSEHFFFAF
jgi:hypothetical protein